MREDDHRNRDRGGHDDAPYHRLLEHFLRVVAIIGPDVARDQRDGAGADCRDSRAHRAEDLCREADRADRFRAEPPHHQHRGEPEDRIERERQDYRPCERPHLGAHAFDRRQVDLGPRLPLQLGNRFEEFRHGFTALRQSVREQSSTSAEVGGP